MTQLLFDPLQCGNCLHMATFRFHPPKKFSRDRQKSHWRVWVGGGGAPTRRRLFIVWQHVFRRSSMSGVQNIPSRLRRGRWRVKGVKSEQVARYTMGVCEITVGRRCVWGQSSDFNSLKSSTWPLRSGTHKKNARTLRDQDTCLPPPLECTVDLNRNRTRLRHHKMIATSIYQSRLTHMIR